MPSRSRRGLSTKVNARVDGRRIVLLPSRGYSAPLYHRLPMTEPLPVGSRRRLYLGLTPFVSRCSTVAAGGAVEWVTTPDCGWA
jgi:hypothetical protein